MTRSSVRLASVALIVVGLFPALGSSASASTEPSMPDKMQGHATMASAMRAHPEMGHMKTTKMRR